MCMQLYIYIYIHGSIRVSMTLDDFHFIIGSVTILHIPHFDHGTYGPTSSHHSEQGKCVSSIVNRCFV